MLHAAQFMVSDKARGDERLMVGLLFFAGFVGISKEDDIHQDKGDKNEREANGVAANEIVNV
jgi:hypothetical protein